MLSCAFKGAYLHSLIAAAGSAGSHTPCVHIICDQIVLAREHVTGFGKLSLIARCVFQEKPIEMFKKTLWLSCGR